MTNTLPVVSFQSTFNTFKPSSKQGLVAQNTFMSADTFESSKASESPEKKNKWKSIAVGVGIALSLIGLSILTKGKLNRSILKPEMIKQLEELVASGKIKQETLDLMMGLIKDTKSNGIKSSYEAMIKYMGIKVAPELAPLEGNGSAFGMYHPNIGDVRLPEDAKLGTIFHELTHFLQFQKVYRAFGKDAMVEAQVEKMVRALEQNPKFAEKELGKPFKNATKEEIELFMKKERNRINSEFNEEFYKRVADANGELTPKELEEAKEYLEAMKNPNHNHTIIEREAYSKEISFENEIKEIIKIVNPKK